MFVALPAEAQALVKAEKEGMRGDGLLTEWRFRLGFRNFDIDPGWNDGEVHYSDALAESSREEVAQVVEDLLRQPRIGETHGDAT